jgi:hypothetical protein
MSVIQVEVSTRPGKTPGTSFQQAEVAFKRFDTGKLESKKLMNFSQPHVFKAMVEARPGDVFMVNTAKNEKSGYWDWIDVKRDYLPDGKVPEMPVQQVQAATQAPVKKEGYATPKSTYETPEERAKKQVYIVKQSSISNAISLLSVGAKTPPSSETILKLAQEFTDFVFAEKKEDLFSLPNDIDVTAEVM